MSRLAKDTVICLMGPTASGKTALALELVQALPCDIISVDSAMVYRGMDIGTAKPTAAELVQAPHRLIDIRDPSEPYSAADFYHDAIAAIRDIQQAGRIPLLVGGTMLYFQALQAGLSPLPAADSTVRERLLAAAKQHGPSYLYERLQQVDPEAAKRIHHNDPQRIQRALEIYEITGQAMSELWQAKLPAPAYQFVNIALLPESREQLHVLIAKRFEKMLEQGFIDEVKNLYQRQDIHADLPAMRAVGYRQAWQYLNGEYDEKTLRDKAIIATRQLAKRQLTWLNNSFTVKAFTAFDQDLAKRVKNFLISGKK